MHICYLEYTRKAEEADARYKRGERQLFCGDCGSRWVWPDECQHEGRLTLRQFNAMWKQSEKEIARQYPSERARSAAAFQKARKEGKV